MKICIKTYAVNKESLNISEIRDFLIHVDKYFDLKNTTFTIPGTKATNDVNLNFDEIISNELEHPFNTIQSIWLNTKNEKNSGSIQLDDSDSFFSLEVELDFSRLDDVINFFSDIKINSLIDFGYAYQSDIQTDHILDISYGANESGLGIKAGLRDVYWLNYYGKEFVNMIGENKIKGLTTYKFVQNNDAIVFIISKNPSEAYQLKDKMKKMIGFDFFVESITSKQPIPEKPAGITGLFKHMLTLAREPRDLREAKKTPSFNHYNKSES